MSLNYTTWFTAICNAVACQSTATGSSTTDPLWALEFPNCIDYSEQRILRELDLLATRVTDASGSLTAQQRTFTLPTAVGTYVVLEYVNVITPSSLTSSAGYRNQLIPVSRSYLDMAWPANSSVAGSSLSNGVPQVYAMQDNATILLGPVPDKAYSVECIGTQRPTPLSANNPTTFLSTMLPDLFFAGTMIKAAAFMRDFGQQSDDPQMSVSWELQYQTLFKSADREEAMKFYRSAGWTAQAPRAVTTPPRQ